MTTKKKVLIVLSTIACAVLLVVGSVAGTLAYLTAQTDPVTNTFTVGNIVITLEESKIGENNDYKYKMIPGSEIEKDPLVTVKGGSEACWLFVKIVENNNSFTNGDATENFVTYVLADGWNKLEDGVYYREVGTSNDNQTFSVFKGDVVTVNENVTKTLVDSLGADAYPTLTLTAYAVQQANVDNAVAAWEIVGN